MTAETLREAAALMRERAEAATSGPWELDDGLIFHPSDGSGSGEPLYVSECYGDANGIADAKYIAGMHPAVALAVADWLDAEARWVDIGAANSPDSEALAVARAYLRSES